MDTPVNETAAIVSMIVSLGVGFLSWLFIGFMSMLLFNKANHRHPWAGFVPIYGNWVFLEVGNQKGWWIFSVIAGLIATMFTDQPAFLLAGYVLYCLANIFASINISKALRKEPALWTVFAFFAYPIWLAVVALSSTKFDARYATGPFLGKLTKVAPPLPEFSSYPVDGYVSPTNGGFIPQSNDYVAKSNTSQEPKTATGPQLVNGYPVNPYDQAPPPPTIKATRF